MNEFDRLAALPPTISTKAELLHRVATRAKPTPEHVCEPANADALELKRLMAQSNEERIAHLRASLDRSSATIRHDQSQARLHGLARTDFEQSR